FEISTSMVAIASTSAGGDICTKSGASAATPPTPAKLTAATFRKSRRRTPSPLESRVESLVVEPSADCALVAIVPLFDTKRSGVPDGTRRRTADLSEARLAGLIASA